MLSLPILNLSGVFFEVVAFLSESFDVALVRRPGGREGREQKIEAGLEARGAGRGGLAWAPVHGGMPAALRIRYWPGNAFWHK